MSIKWIVDQYMVDHNEQDIVGLLRQEGFEVHVAQPHILDKTIDHPFEEGDCVVVYGTLQFAKKSHKEGFIPGAYLQDNNMQCTAYTSQWPSVMLNDTHVYATFADLCRRPDFYQNIFGGDLFVRPNSGGKVFSGLVIGKDEWDTEINALRQTSSVEDDTLVMVAPVQTIEGEYRMMVVNREVVTGSQYQQNGAEALDACVPEDVYQFTHYIAQQPWQPDICYVCDVARTSDGLKLLEINALSTSGWYLADIPKLAKKVAEAALLEWAGELSIGDMPIKHDNTLTMRKH